MNEDKLRRDIKKEVGKHFNDFESEQKNTQEEIKKTRKELEKEKKEKEKLRRNQYRRERTLKEWMAFPFKEAIVILAKILNPVSKVLYFLFNPLLKLYQKALPWAIALSIIAVIGFFVLSTGVRRATQAARDEGMNPAQYILRLPFMTISNSAQFVFEGIFSIYDGIYSWFENQMHYAIHGEYISDVDGGGDRTGLFMNILDEGSLFFTCRNNTLRAEADVRTITDEGINSTFECNVEEGDCRVDPYNVQLRDGLSSPLRMIFSIYDEHGDYELSLTSRFEFESHATLEAYFVSEDYYISRRDEDGNIPGIPSVPNSIASDSPLTIGLELGNHPVIDYVSQQDIYPFGFTIRNNWDGVLKELKTISIIAPSWVESISCDFVSDDEISKEGNSFLLDVSDNIYLEAVYDDIRDFVTFNCEYEMEELDDDISMDYFIVSADYLYKSEESTTLELRENPEVQDCIDEGGIEIYHDEVNDETEEFINHFRDSDSLDVYNRVGDLSSLGSVDSHNDITTYYSETTSSSQAAANLDSDNQGVHMMIDSSGDVYIYVNIGEGTAHQDGSDSDIAILFLDSDGDDITTNQERTLNEIKDYFGFEVDDLYFDAPSVDDLFMTQSNIFGSTETNHDNSETTDHFITYLEGSGIDIVDSVGYYEVFDEIDVDYIVVYITGSSSLNQAHDFLRDNDLGIDIGVHRDGRVELFSNIDEGTYHSCAASSSSIGVLVETEAESGSEPFYETSNFITTDQKESFSEIKSYFGQEFLSPHGMQSLFIEELNEHNCGSINYDRYISSNDYDTFVLNALT